MRDVKVKTSLSDATIRRMSLDGRFPKPLRIGKRIAWLETDVDSWMTKVVLRNKAVEKMKKVDELKDGSA